ncbi:MAG: hypothetical protein COX81_03415 [Candidatus Magasanikbacteria bacterium CG_4_10_14_0_2_um_filter_37_12]|uniref:Uncharacterized protein n=1 Tax=Candidatus Magasanikbacteria bacterium CG_4_10_14_0_2_um_filter_37_12 TaxID=1974637 RepID=A0A2M7V738_9BACT|nr:MAG: hypothetical protein COX81_03415 [Candidatus Magasanikbacteria bacterium CG_4_10_14_0_2_um_filter_37_12]
MCDAFEVDPHGGRKDTVLHKLNTAQPKETYYINAFNLDPGRVIGWIDEYKAEPKARKHHIEAFFKEKLTHYLSQFDEEEQKTVKAYLTHFGIVLDQPSPPKPPATILTPKQIGHLNPNVPHAIEKGDGTGDPPPPETADILNEDGIAIEYIRRPVGTWTVGITLTRKDDASQNIEIEYVQLKVLGSLKDDEQMVVCDVGNGTGTVIARADLENYYEIPTPETGKPFKYDKAKASEYGMAEVRLEAHPKAQELFDKIIGRDVAFLGTDGTLYREEVQRYWNTHCTDLNDPTTDATLPEKSWLYFEQLAAGRISDTIDGDSGKTPTKKHTPHFGKSNFFLVMDFPEFDWDNEEEKKDALRHPSMKILKQLFDKEDPTAIIRDEINTALWEDHDKRIQSKRAKAVIAELLGIADVNDPEIDNYEFTLIRQDQYARLSAGQAGMAQTKNYGQKDLWTHFDGYVIREDGERSGLVGGDREDGGAADVGYDWRDNRSDVIAVRLVLQRKQ